MAILAIHSVWNGVRIFRQRSAVREIQPFGWTFRSRASAPIWLLDRFLPIETELGILLGEVVAVNADESLSRRGDVSWTYGIGNCTNLTPHSNDSGLDALGRLASLEVLSLDGLQITDNGLVNLRGLSRLRILSLARTPVSDAGLVHLHGLKRLQSLSLTGTNTSDRGVEDLKRSLPMLKVTR
jgi:hypothetical protein